MLRGRLTTIGLAGLVTLAMVPASAGAATFTDDSTADFTNGTPGADTWAVDGSVRLAPTGLKTDFDALPDGLEGDPQGRGRHVQPGGILTLDGARVESDTTLSPGRVPGVPGLVRRRPQPACGLRRGPRPSGLGH